MRSSQSEIKAKDPALRETPRTNYQPLYARRSAEIRQFRGILVTFFATKRASRLEAALHCSTGGWRRKWIYVRGTALPPVPQSRLVCSLWLELRPACFVAKRGSLIE